MTESERTSAQSEEQDQTTGASGLFGKLVETAKNVVGTVTETAKEVVETVVERAPGVVASATSAVGNAANTVVERVQDRVSEEPAAQSPPTATEERASPPEPEALSTATDDAMPAPEVLVSATDDSTPAPEVLASATDDSTPELEALLTTTDDGTPEPEALLTTTDDGPPEPEALATAVDDGASTQVNAPEVREDAVPSAEAAAAPQSEEQGEGVLAATAAAVADAASAVRSRVARVYGAAVAAVQPSEQPAPAPAARQEGATYQPEAEGGAKSGKPRRFKDVQPGMHLQGKVTSIALYGIFVDVGVGRDGLVHISEMSDKRIESPTDLVEIGTPVDVWVKSVDPDARRISLTMRDPERAKPERTERRGPRKREVNREKLAEMKPGDTVEGVISSLAPFGAFVDLGVGKDGLVHVSELAEGRVERPEDAVQVGERYTFKVLEVDPDGNRISLSLRRAQRTQRMQQLESGTIMDGTISGIAPFGAFVDIGVGRDGLVHVSELSSERVGSVEEAVKVGDKVQVKVIEVDAESKRISLTMRVDEPLPRDRERPAPRAANAPAFGDSAPPYSPPPAFGGAPAYGSPPPFDEGRGGDRRGGTRRGGGRDTGREGGRPEGGRDAGRVAGAAPRRDRGERGGSRAGGDGSRGGRREGQIFEPAQETYTFEDPEEETFTGDATLEDLVSKFNAGKGRDKRPSQDDDDEAGNQRADAIRRTLAMRDEE